ncbi:hypothetical protein RSAG8_08820, partial [Rhizoctonia solani AG-8 WAC10335]
MQRQLQHACDTALHKAKKNKALNLKPLDHLSKKSRVQVKKKLLETKKKSQAPKKSRVEAPVAPVQTAEDSTPSSPSPAHSDDLQSILDEHTDPVDDLDLGGDKEPPAPVAPNVVK